ncbi:MAG: hypothetical protein RBQ97_11900, partial [Acholeplasma sp.]|nr:hypothetical protein [Acholeplasma sp.]
MSYNQKINFFMLVVFSLTPFLAPFFITPMTYESEYFIFSNAHSIQLQENEKSFIRLNHDEVSNYSDWKDDSEIYNIKHYKYSTVFRSYDGLTVSYDDVKSTISLLDIAINPYNNDVTTG